MTYQGPAKKPFAWSFSRMKNFMTCPKKHYHVDLAKDFKEDNENNEPMLWGNAVHKAMEEYLKHGTALPTTMERYEAWPSRVLKLKDMGLKVDVERQLAFGRDYRATGYFAADTWCRAKVDVSITLPEKLKAMITLDWKTGGKVHPEYQQLAISAQAIFAHHPEIDTVIAIYVWFGHNTQTVKKYSRAEMAPIWNEMHGIISTMDVAWRTTTYPPKPSGICIRHCPVTSCPFHGKGSR